MTDTKEGWYSVKFVETCMLDGNLIAIDEAGNWWQGHIVAEHQLRWHPMRETVWPSGYDNPVDLEKR